MFPLYSPILDPVNVSVQLPETPAHLLDSLLHFGAHRESGPFFCILVDS